MEKRIYLTSSRESPLYHKTLRNQIQVEPRKGEVILIKRQGYARHVEIGENERPIRKAAITARKAIDELLKTNVLTILDCIL